MNTFFDRLKIGNTELDWHRYLRPLYRGVHFANGGFTKATGEKLPTDGVADAIVYGKSFLVNPDLPKRFNVDAELNDWDQSTFYSPGEKGCTDYPMVEGAKAA